MSKKTKRVRRGCHGGICACMGTCTDIIEVPIDDPRPEYTGDLGDGMQDITIAYIDLNPLRKN